MRWENGSFRQWIRSASAGVAVTDAHDVQVRLAARGGLGAVMGSKGVKAIVVDDTDAKPADPCDAKFLQKTNKELNQAILSDPRLENRRKYRTSAS